MKAIKIIKLLVIILLSFFFGIFISLSKEPFNKLKILFIVTFILFVYNAYPLFKKGQKEEFKKYLCFGVIGIVFLVLGFSIGIMKMFKLEISGPIPSMLIFFLLYFTTIPYILFAYRNSLIFNPINYFVGIISLIMGLLFLYGFIKDYISGILSYPYNIIIPTIISCLFFLSFITIIMGIKNSKKIKLLMKKK